MNLLTIDIGNSRCKICSGPIKEGFPAKKVLNMTPTELEQYLDGSLNPEACLVSSVRSDTGQSVRLILEKRFSANSLFFLDSRTSPLPLDIASPETLGSDRIAAAFAAYLRAQRSTIVVDAGTALTIDLVNDQGVFCGGTIFPGIQLQLDSLHRQTDQLPRLDWDQEQVPPLLGKKTEQAIRSGIFWSQVGGMERIVSNLAGSCPDIPIFVSGGCGQPLLQASSLKGEYIENLVLRGLWEIGVRRARQQAD
ncbi:MAG: type III pantothenate kinase [Planctomycetota bacterium]|nr:type III pantothenate kinase [Planctomycetota bacterium]